MLPFRLFSSSDAGTPRATYAGLGAGKHGVDGGSFWFFESPEEPGALDRVRWEANGTGKRAVWTVWLLG